MRVLAQQRIQLGLLGRSAEYFFCAFALGKPEGLGAPSHGVPLAQPRRHGVVQGVA